MQVIIKREHRNEHEGNEIYNVVEDNGDRLLITPVVSTLRWPGVELVRRHQVEEI